MDLTEGSETSANINQTLGKHPKVNTVNTEHSESLKSRNIPKNLPSYTHYKQTLHGKRMIVCLCPSLDVQTGQTDSK
jgi:hypothetical protein